MVGKANGTAAGIAAAAAALADSPLLWNVAGVAAFTLYDATEWAWYHYAIFTALIVAALELLSFLVMASGKVLGWDAPNVALVDAAPRFEDAEMQFIDRFFISTNKLLTALFTYHVLRYSWVSGNVEWDLGRVSLWNTVLALPALYVVYDLPYCLFHRLLHVPALYPWVHKHHHRQHSPFRGNVDAVNVHTFEFVCGEYNHLLAIHLTALGLAALGARLPAGAAALLLATPSGSVPSSPGVHLLALGIFIVAGGVLASLNHTRYDVSIPGLSSLFRVAYHDVHHATDQRSNYSQYSTLWDRLLGTFVDYDAPKAAAKAAKRAAAKAKLGGEVVDDAAAAKAKAH